MLQHDAAAAHSGHAGLELASCWTIGAASTVACFVLMPFAAEFDDTYDAIAGIVELNHGRCPRPC